jgi:hypothetical protein
LSRGNNQKGKSLKFFAGIVDTGDKFFTGIVDTAEQFIAGVIDTGD